MTERKPPLDQDTLETLGNPADQEVITAAVRYNTEHHGGVVHIEYQPNHVVMAPLSDVTEMLTVFGVKTADERAEIMQSVNAAIARLWPLVSAGKASQQEFIDCAQDIAIWYANEVFEGRASLAHH